MLFLDRLDESEGAYEDKNKFSEVVRKASEEGPQTVTAHGKSSIVVLSAEDYRKLEQPQTSLVEFLAAAEKKLEASSGN